MQELQARPAVKRKLGSKPMNIEVPIGYVDTISLRMKDEAADDMMVRDLEGYGPTKIIRQPPPLHP